MDLIQKGYRYSGLPVVYTEQYHRKFFHQLQHDHRCLPVFHRNCNSRFFPPSLLYKTISSF